MANVFQFPDEDWSDGLQDVALDTTLNFTLASPAINAFGLEEAVGVMDFGWLCIDESQGLFTSPLPQGGTVAGKGYMY